MAVIAPSLPATLDVSLSAARILIVDDNAIDLHFLKRLLLNAGYVNIALAANGEEALRSIEQTRTELVILDLRMPVMDGFEFCRTIRRLPPHASLPVIVQTAALSSAECLAAFEAGASDFVPKPIAAGELCARVKVHLERRMLLRELERYRARIAEELECARVLQQSILPQPAALEHISQDCGLEIAAYSENSSEVGGDLWDIHPLYTGQPACWIADFSGHGIAASLNAFRLHAYLKQSSPLSSAPGEYLAEINEKLLLHALKGQFATIFYAIVDNGGDQLIHAAAGCPRPILLRRNGDVERIDGSGMPLGISLYDYPTRRTAFHPGDMLILYSDALIETADENGDFLEEESWLSLIGRHQGASPQQMLDLILARLRAHSCLPYADDLTLAIFRRRT